MGNDLRTALGNAISAGKVEAAPAASAAPVTPVSAPVAPVAPVTPPAPVEAKPAVPRDDAGKFAPKADATPAGAEPVVAKPTRTVKPPAAWTPAAREKWATLPEDLQDEIARTERAATARIQQAAAAEKRWAAMQETLRPYEGVFKVAGMEPEKAIDNALRAMATLRSGTPAEKARLLASYTGEYGVPVDELDKALSEALSGQAQTAPAQPKTAEFRDPRFDAFMAQMQQAQRAKVASTLTEFAAKHEFFDDLKDTIAGLLEAKVAKDLPSAYDAALKLHPEISGVLEQRKAAEAARTSNAAIERSIEAASSVRASPVSASASAPTDLRSQLAANLRR